MEPFTVTLERIRLYAQGTEDFNPLYLDEEAAKDSHFESIIAPPTILTPIIFASVPPGSWVKMPGAINPGQYIEFGVPVRPNDTLHIKAKLTDKYIMRGKKYTVGE